MEDFWTAKEFWSAIIGAVVGGAIGLLGQWLTAFQASRLKKSETEDRRRALGHSILFKIIKIHSQLANLRQFMRDASEKKNQIEGPSEFWQFVLPLANLPSQIHFDADEMGMVLSLKDNEVFNSILGLDVVHNDLVMVFITYGKLRNDFSNKLPQSDFAGQVGTFKITQQQFAELRPKMIELNDLASQMVDRCEMDAKEAWKALEEVSNLFKKNLDMAYSIENKFDH